MGMFQAILKMSVLFVFVIIPTIAAVNSPPPPSLSKPANPPPPQPSLAPLSSSSPPPLPVPSKSPPAANPSPPICPQLLQKEMVARVLKRLKAPKTIKSILNKSAKFGVCIAGKFCDCIYLQFQPLIYGCFAVIGAKCMKNVISGRVYGCTLGCAKSMMNNGQRVDDAAVGDFCYSKCMMTA